MGEDNKKKEKAIRQLAAMNKDLEEWVKETDKKDGLPKEIERKTTEKKDAPQGRCEICDAKDAKEVCIKCGKAVCSSCYFSLVGLCEKCVSKETVEKWKNKHRDWEKVLGVDWID